MTESNQAEAMLEQANIIHDHLYQHEKGFQIECYGRRAASLRCQLEKAGFTSVTAQDEKSWRPLADKWTWYAVAQFSLPQDTPAPVVTNDAQEVSVSAEMCCECGIRPAGVNGYPCEQCFYSPNPEDQDSYIPFNEDNDTIPQPLDELEAEREVDEFIRDNNYHPDDTERIEINRTDEDTECSCGRLLDSDGKCWHCDEKDVTDQMTAFRAELETLRAENAALKAQLEVMRADYHSEHAENTNRVIEINQLKQAIALKDEAFQAQTAQLNALRDVLRSSRRTFEDVLMESNNPSVTAWARKEIAKIKHTLNNNE